MRVCGGGGIWVIRRAVLYTGWSKMYPRFFSKIIRKQEEHRENSKNKFVENVQKIFMEKKQIG